MTADLPYDVRVHNTPGNDAPWTPDAYVLRRTFCPISQIQTWLAEFRRQVGAANMVVLAFDQRTVFRNLTFWDLTYHELDITLSAHRDANPEINRKLEETQPFWSALDVETLQQALHLARQEQIQFLGHAKAFYSALSVGVDNLNLVPLSSRSVENRASIEVLLLSDVRIDETVSTRAVSHLRNMVNGTAYASLNRDSRVLTRVNQALAARGTWKERTQSLLQMSKDVTESVGVALYLYDVSGYPAAALELEIALDSGEISLTTDRFPIEPDSEPLPAPVRTFLNGRPIIQEATEGTDLHTTWSTSAQRHTEIVLAVPSSGDGPPLGVLALFKRDADYSEYDIALLRNVSLRISTTITNSRINEFLERMHMATQALLGRKGDEVPSASHFSLEAALDTSDLPYDLAKAAQQAAGDLVQAGLLANAHSVTLRLVTPAESDPSSQVLRRVLAWPAKRLNEEGRELAVDEFSVNGWVGLHGEPASINDLRGGRSKKYVRMQPRVIAGRGSVAEYCLPIQMDDRLIGTINFESPVPRAFNDARELLNAVGAQFGTRVLATRLAHSADIVGLTEDLAASAHELINLKEELVELSSSGGSNAQLFMRAITELEEIAGNIEPQRPDTLPEVESPHLFDDYVYDLLMGSRITVRYAPESVTEWRLQWSPSASRRVGLALREVVRNMVSYSADEIPEVATGSYLLGGRRYHEVAIFQPHPLTVWPDITRLYRVPIAGDDRIHFGAFAAGEIIRRLGGDIRAQPSSLHRHIKVSISLPVEMK